MRKLFANYYGAIAAITALKMLWLMSGNWCVWLAEPHEARATLHLKSLSSVRMRVGLGRPSEGVGPSPTTYPT